MLVSIFHHYLLWHYTRAFFEILHVWVNIFWFVVNFFSLPQLIKSYFAPWKRMTEDRGKAFNFEDMASFVIIGLISRIIGIILRTTIIATGTIILLFMCIAFLAIYAFWVLAPAVILGLLIYGITLIFS